MRGCALIPLPKARSHFEPKIYSLRRLTSPWDARLRLDSRSQRRVLTLNLKLTAYTASHRLGMRGKRFAENRQIILIHNRGACVHE